MTFRDYIINVYILTDEILKLIKHKHKTNNPKFSDVELITLIIFSMSFRKGDYKITLKEFKENYNDLFPYVPQLPAIVKRAKKLYKLAQVISIILTNLFSEKITTVYIADTKPIPVCKNQRMKRNKKVSGKLYKGNNAAKEWFGFKIGLIVDYYKRPIGYEIIPASKHDINFLKEVKEDSVLIDILNKGTIIADKAFNSKDLKEEFKSLGIELEAIRKKGKVHHKQKDKQEFLKRVRKRIETVFSKLYYMGIEDIRAVSLEGFKAKINFFILALSFATCLGLF